MPVRVERTGLRTIAVGAGDTTSLALPYLPANADVKAGDLLVTSGLGGVFPAGYPVARVTEVHRDAVQPLAQVRAAPLAHVDTDSEVMLVWFRADHPAAPAPATDASGELKHGNPAMQPRPAPPKPRTAPAADDAATAEDPADAAARKRAAPAPRGRQAGGRRRGAARRRRPGSHERRVAPAHAAHGTRGADPHGAAAAAVARRAAPDVPGADRALLVDRMPRAPAASRSASSPASLLDVFQGPVLGEHALALALVTYIAVREHQRIRSKPAFQQALIVFAALVLYEVVLFAIDGWTGHPVTSPLRWVHTADRRADLAAGGGAARLRRGPARVRTIDAATVPTDRSHAGRTHQGSLARAAPLRPARAGRAARSWRSLTVGLIGAAVPAAGDAPRLLRRALAG